MQAFFHSNSPCWNPGKMCEVHVVPPWAPQFLWAIPHSLPYCATSLLRNWKYFLLKSKPLMTPYLPLQSGLENPAWILVLCHLWRLPAKGFQLFASRHVRFQLVQAGMMLKWGISCQSVYRWPAYFISFLSVFLGCLFTAKWIPDCYLMERVFD